MGIILQIALRNLREHRAKTIIICSLIALGMFLLVLGNSVIDTGKVGTQKSFIQSFSGDILVGPINKEKANPSMFGSGFGGPVSEPTPTIPKYQEVYEYLKALPGIQAVNPQIYGALQIEISDDWRAFVGFLGVDTVVYNQMFPDNIEIIQGHFLAEGEEGLMLPEKIYKEVEDKVKIKYDAGKIVKLVTFGSGTRIKNIPIAGVFRFKSSNTSLRDIGIMDISSLRYMMGMVVGASSQIKVEAAATNMLDASLDNLDSFYGEESIVSTKSLNATTDLTEAQLSHILGDTSQRSAMAKADSGAWHYVLLRVKDGTDVAQVIGDLNKHFKETNSELVALDWEGASGPVASVAILLRIVFYVLVFIIAIISIIVIMNTMVVSIIERTAEIGTMRALGAQRNYIRQIFITESLTLAFFGGVIGLLLASVLIGILHSTGIVANNSLLEMAFGGKILYPVLSWTSAIQTLVLMLIVGMLSSWYPTAVALRISPVKAMSNS